MTNDPDNSIDALITALQGMPLAESLPHGARLPARGDNPPLRITFDEEELLHLNGDDGTPQPDKLPGVMAWFEGKFPSVRVVPSPDLLEGPELNEPEFERDNEQPESSEDLRRRANQVRDHQREEPESEDSRAFAAGEAPLPLTRDPPPAWDFPLDALPPVARAAARAIVIQAQVPAALAGVAVLGAMSIVTQGHADAILPFGGTRPSSLYLMSLADSGERKSTVDAIACAAIRAFTSSRLDAYKLACARFKIATADYEAAVRPRKGGGSPTERPNERPLRSGRNADRRQRSLDEPSIAAAAAAERASALDRRLAEAGDKPQEPVNPRIVMSDVTIEGMIKSAQHAFGCMALVTAEAGILIGGYSMKEETRLHTAATFSALWDEGTAERTRASDEEPLNLKNRRLTMSLATQPQNGLGFLASADLGDQGFLSRLLVAWPASNIGVRGVNAETLARSAAQAPALATWAEALTAHLEALPFATEMAPRPVKLSDAAIKRWIEFYNEVESSMAEGGANEMLKAFANKSGEQVVRLAVVMEVFNNRNAVSVAEATMEAAIRLMRYFLNESSRIVAAGSTQSDITDAQAMWKFVREIATRAGGRRQVHLKELYTFGPSRLRTSAAAGAVMTTLVEHGYVVRLKDRPKIDGTRRSSAWEVRPEALDGPV